MHTTESAAGPFARWGIVALFSAASCGLAQPPDDPGKTPAEWLAEIDEMAAAEKDSWNGRWRDVMRGAAVALEPYDGRPEMIAKLSGEKKRLYEAYRRVWDEHARTVAEKLLAGKSLGEPDRRYRFLASGTLVHKYLRHGIRQKEKAKEPLSVEEKEIAAYARAVEQAGRAALAKGYRGGTLTAADVDALRDYAMFVDARCTGNGVLPCHLGLTRSRYGGGGFRMPGEAAPDFALARMEAFLDTPQYTDENPREPVDVLTPLVVKEFLQVMCGFELRDGKVVAKPYEIAPGREEEYVRLRDYRGEKAVLLVLMNATDPWAWHGKIAPMLEPLKQALGRRAVVHFISTTIHDTRMPSMDFIGAQPRRTSYVHETAMERRARICKMFYMGWPSATAEYLLDDMAQHFRNEWMDQGGGAYLVLVDREGTIAYADYHQDIPPHWGPTAVDFPYEFLTIRMNHLESRLGSFFAGGGRYDKSIETDYPTWRLPPGRDRRSLGARLRQAVWMPATVTAVDPGGRRVSVERALPPREEMKGIRFWDDAGDEASPFDPIVKARLETVRAWLADPRETPTYELLMEDSTDTFVNGWEKPPSELRVGDRVGVCYAVGEDKSRTIRPLQVRAYRIP
jgi:hypothetical protein